MACGVARRRHVIREAARLREIRQQRTRVLCNQPGHAAARYSRRASVIVPMAGPVVITFASMFDDGRRIDVSRSLFDESAFGPDIRSSVPRVMAAFIDVTRARRGDDFFARRWRSNANLDFDAARLCDAGDGANAKAQCHGRNCASNPHGVSFLDRQPRSHHDCKGRGYMGGPRRARASFGAPAAVRKNRRLSDRQVTGPADKASAERFRPAQRVDNVLARSVR